MEQIRTIVKKYWILLAIILVIIISGSAYAFGYRVDTAGITRVGTLTLTDLPVGTTVYVEQALRDRVQTAGNVSLELMPGTHAVIVSAPNEYPWSSTISITSGTETRINPFLVSMKIPVTPLTGADATAAANAIVAATLPSTTHSIQLANGCASVYVENNQVIEEASTSTPGCVPPHYLCLSGTCQPTIIFAPIAPITSVFRFPNRQDALTISFAGSLYAISLDPTSPQFFAPLVRGTDPHFGQLSDGTIVVHDGTVISKLGL